MMSASAQSFDTNLRRDLGDFYVNQNAAILTSTFYFRRRRAALKRAGVL